MYMCMTRHVHVHSGAAERPDDPQHAVTCTDTAVKACAKKKELVVTGQPGCRMFLPVWDCRAIAPEPSIFYFNIDCEHWLH
jgi:hypothetical protein